MLTAFWSATGGSATSVVTAACAIAAARRAQPVGGGVRVADLAGDLPAVFGLGSDPDVGLADWLEAGPEAPTEALDRLLVEVVPGLTMLPRGRGRTHRDGGHPVPPAPESGAALAAALSHDRVPVLVDCGTARQPAEHAVVEVADVSLLVTRGCYLALRRAVRSPNLAHTTGVVLIEEPGRSLGGGEIADVLDLPIVVRIPVKAAIARAVDAGVLTSRTPDALARPALELARRIATRSDGHGEAA